MIPTILKYAFSAVFALASIPAIRKTKYCAAALLELAAIFAIMDLLLLPLGRAAWVLSGLVMLLFNAQLLVLCFGGSYTTLVMLTNLDSWQDLLGKMGQYIAAILAVLVFTALPISPSGIGPVGDLVILCVSFFLQLLLMMACGPACFPLYGLFDLIATVVENRRMTRQVKDAKTNLTGRFFREDVPGFRTKPASLPENPNIVLIFTEGLSTHMITDKRGIMPNTARFMESSLSFSRYYNHTYATYCALIGQLYSGYQLNNYDANSLVSLQSILKDRGYDTVMINTEPKNKLFRDYLGRLGFDRVLGNDVADLHGEAHSLSDGQAYDLLYQTIEAQAAEGKPFLTAIYTFGSHISFDSPQGEAKFGGGKDTTLNKMHNVDVQFGAFMKKLEESSFADNTLVVFTGDHCAYGDLFYRKAFPAYTRVNTDVDEMPLVFWHKGVRPEKIDAVGRNTLDMVPTLLDYLDLSAPNYFLGRSLFGSAEANANPFDTCFYDATYTRSTEKGNIRPLTDTEEKRLKKNLQRYFIAKAQKPLVPENKD